MQEEVEQKTMALSVRTARLTAELLQKAFRQFLKPKRISPRSLTKMQTSKVLSLMERVRPE